jgi:hypothetical protein
MNIPHARLINQHIAQHDFQTPADVVRWMGAMQAQDYLQALWGIGARMQSPTVAAIEQAIANREILRTWPMRGTIHFVAPEDALWITQLSAIRMIEKDQLRLSQLELDQAIINRSRDLFIGALQGGGKLSRSAILQVLEDQGISTKGGRGYHILWHLAQTGVICIGPTEQKEQTFVLLDEWVDNRHRRYAREEALAELARRYCTSHGPATAHDFAWWSGLTVTDAKAGLSANKDRLISEKIDGREYWMAVDTPTHDPKSLADVYLLAGFDEYLLGYKDRGAVLDPQHANKVCPGANGIFFPMIVSNGQIAGTWKRTVKPKNVAITHDAFTGFSESEAEQFEAAARRYAEFLGLPPVLG